MAWTTISGAIGAAFIAAACAGAPPPSDRMANAEAALRAAREVGGENVPTAQLHVKLAEEQIEKAKRLMGDNENERADYVLQRASADAELALALAKEENTRNAAQSALQQVHQLESPQNGAPAQASPTRTP